MKRPLPHRDDKIVTAWNGLMIAAIARGARLLARPDLLDAARRAMEFIRENLWDDGQLYRSHRGRNSGVAGFPADHAFLISALIELHSADGDAAHLDWALQLQQAMDEAFWDATRGGYVLKTELAGETLLVMREDYDGAEPSPGHVAAENLLKLAILLDRPEFATRAEAILRAEARVAATQPFSVPVLLSALDLLERGVMKIELCGPPSRDLDDLLRTQYLPRAVFIHSPGNGEVIVCEGMICHRPIRSAVEWRG